MEALQVQHCKVRVSSALLLPGPKLRNRPKTLLEVGWVFEKEQET